MYSLLFRSKWVAALWVGSLVAWIWFTTPREDGAGPAAALAVAGAAQLAGAPAGDRPDRAEQRRRAELEAFNSGATDPLDDGFAGE